MNSMARIGICARCKDSISHRVIPRITRSPLKRSYVVKSSNHAVRPFRLAVIGSGPAGFYTAYKVMSKIENSKVDMYEQLPVPYGLVRFGVAPDHPEVKNCQVKFEEVAASPNFNFIGNIRIGSLPGQLPLETLMPHYDAILLAYGASKDRTLGIPGENTLKGIYSARDFVGWYNGHPEYAHLNPDLTRGEEATIIGQGNVALDVARILLQHTASLRSTDIAEHAIENLQKSKVKRVRIVGRRGPLQAAYTIKEIRELIKLTDVAFHPLDNSLIPEDTKTLPRAPRRIMEVLKKGSSLSVLSAPRSWSLDFCLSPTQFKPSESSNSLLGGISFERTRLDPDVFDPAAKAIGTGEVLDFSSSLAFRSIGYKSEPLPGSPSLNWRIPFNHRLGIIPNDGYGRVNDWDNTSGEMISDIPRLYCAGWVKRGPTGVIASTMQDAFSTADAIAEDWSLNCGSSLHSGMSEGKNSGLGWDGVRDYAERNGCRQVSWKDWQKIDAAEKRVGQSKGKEREKFTNIADMLAVLD